VTVRDVTPEGAKVAGRGPIGVLGRDLLPVDESLLRCQLAHHHVLRIWAVGGAEEHLIDDHDMVRRPGPPSVQQDRCHGRSDGESMGRPHRMIPSSIATFPHGRGVLEARYVPWRALLHDPGAECASTLKWADAGQPTTGVARLAARAPA